MSVSHSQQPAVSIRSATEADLAVILDIYNEAILNTTAVYDEFPHTLEMRRSWFHAKHADDLPVLVAERAGAIVGFGSLGWFRAWTAYRYTVENSLYVEASSRRQGTGRLLLKALIASAKARQFHAMVAGIDADNSGSCQLHEEFGFKEVGHFHQVGYKFDRWLDLKFFELLL